MRFVLVAIGGLTLQWHQYDDLQNLNEYRWHFKCLWGKLFDSIILNFCGAGTRMNMSIFSISEPEITQESFFHFHNQLNNDYIPNIFHQKFIFNICYVLLKIEEYHLAIWKCSTFLWQSSIFRITPIPECIFYFILWH